MTGGLPAGRWRLADGGLDELSWCIVGVYAVAFLLAVTAVVAARRGRRQVSTLDRAEERSQVVLARVWIVVAIALAVMGINKQLDLQGWFVQTLRRTSVEDGWYLRRREYQAEVITGLFALGLIVTGVLAYLLRRVVWRIVFVIAAVVALGVFVAVRAISFHYVDRLLELGGRYGLDPMLEVGSLGLVIVATLQWLWAERRIVERTVARGAVSPARPVRPPMPFPPPTLTPR